MPGGMKAPKLCPADPWKVSRMVSSGSPSGPQRRVTSLPVMVPTTRFTLRMGTTASTFFPCSMAGRHSSSSVVTSSDCSMPWSWTIWQVRAHSFGTRGWKRMREKSRFRAFQWSTARRISSRSGWPTISSMVRKPSSAMYSRSSVATKRMKFTTWAGSPVKRLRSSGSWVATPTGQVLRWQTRIMMQPRTTSGAVAKPNSSAPSSAATATSRPVLSWPSASTVTRERRLLRSNT